MIFKVSGSLKSDLVFTPQLLVLIFLKGCVAFLIHMILNIYKARAVIMAKEVYLKELHLGELEITSNIELENFVNKLRNELKLSSLSL